MSLADPIEDSKVIVVYQAANVDNTGVAAGTLLPNPFTFSMYVPFEAEEMYVRSIQVNPNAGGQYTTNALIWTDIIQDYIGSAAVDTVASVVSPNTRFKINSRQRLVGKSTFRLDLPPAVGVPVPTTPGAGGTLLLVPVNPLRCNISLTLEFVRYKRQVPIASGRKTE